MKRLTSPRLMAMLAACLMLLCIGHAAAQYQPDPTYNNGSMTDDQFNAFDYFNHTHDGRKVVRLSNGDVIIAGTTSIRGTVGAIGLMRRNANGYRVNWENPGEHAASSWYVAYPGTSSINIVQVRDMSIVGQYLFILADTNNGQNTSFGTRIYVFGTDGSFITSALADTKTSNEREVWGGGVGVYTTAPLPWDNPTVLYIGRKKVAGGHERIVFRRFTFDLDTNQLTAQTNAIHPNISTCSATKHCSAFGIAFGGGDDYLPPRTYITGSIMEPGCAPSACPVGWYSYAAQIDPLTGASTGWGFKHLITNTRGRAIAVKPRWNTSPTPTPDDVFVLSENPRTCRDGMVLSARTAGSVPEVHWDKEIGGSDASGSLCLLNNVTAVPHDIAYQDDRLAAVGYLSSPPLFCASPPCEDVVNGAIAVLDAATGNAISPLTRYIYPNPSSRTRHSAFTGVVGTGSGTFTVAGNSRIFNTDSTAAWRGKRQFISMRVREKTTLFDDGFESNGATPEQPSWLYAPQYEHDAIRVYHLVNGSYELLHSADLPAGTKPNAVTFDSTGKMWVVGANRTLLRFSRENINSQLAPIPEVTVTPAGVGSYFQMAFWGDNAYLSNSDFSGTHRIQRFSLATLNAGGSPSAAQTFTNGSFNVPAGLAFDAQGKLWISHYSGQSITRLNVSNGSVERTIGSINHNGNPSLSNPEGMAFNATGDLLVGNNGRPSYARYSAATLSGSGNTPAHLEVMSPETNPAPRSGYIGGLAMDRDGDLWFNYQRQFQIREYRPNNSAGQTLDDATNDPGFGGIAFWPIPATLHRGQ